MCWREGMPSRGTWACENLMKFHKAKCKVLHMGQDHAKHKQQVGWRMD